MQRNMINPRRSIHSSRDALSSLGKECKNESRTNESKNEILNETHEILDETLEHFSTESDSEYEDYDQPETTANFSAINKYYQEPDKRTSVNFRKCVLTVFIAVFIGYLFCRSQSKTDEKCSYEILKHEYPQQDDLLWRTLKVGVELILNERTQMPAVYLFVHHDKQKSFQLIEDIAKHTSSCFSHQMQPILLERADFSEENYGVAIEKYKSRITKGNVVLIADLNEIPAEAARALHSICDTYSPIAKNVVIFLTLHIPPFEEGNYNSNAEDFLVKLWGSKLNRNVLDPLITRVTNEVIALKS